LLCRKKTRKNHMTRTHIKRHSAGALPLLTLAVLLVCMLAPAWAQQDGSSSGQSGSGQAAPASGQSGTAAPSTDQSSPDQTNGAPPAATAPGSGPDIENPPLSGLDEPTSEPAYGGRSYLVPGLQLSESVNSTTSGLNSKSSGVDESARGLGSLDLQKIWKKYQLGLDYVAGGTVYQGHIHQAHLSNMYQNHNFAMDQRILWRNGQLAFRDSFAYLPEGSFGFGSFGGAGGFGSALGGGGTNGGAGTGLGGGITGGTPGGGSLGGGTIGSVGIQPRIDNTSIIDVTQSFSPRSTVTAAVSYDYTDFLSNAQSSLLLINSQMSSAQVGYDYKLTQHDQLSATYTYQSFHFPRTGSGNVETQQWHLLYGHRISGRLNLVVGGGPQLIVFHNPTISVPSKITGSGKAQLSYQLSSRTSAQVSYMHYTSAGSGFFAGANTDLVNGSVNHLFGRNWSFATNVGYSRNSQLQASLQGASAASTYKYLYAGSSIHRQLGRYFGAFVSYQYTDIKFNSSVCTVVGTCGNSSGQQVGLVGIDWHPHPFRLD
jgi:hypothetical protein